MKIIGIAGTDGSGKDTVGELLADQGWLFVSVTDLLRYEAKRRHVPMVRSVLRGISAEWRREHGLGVLVDKALEEYRRQEDGLKLAGLAIASLRNPGEADRVHELGGQVVWIDANPKVRYERIMDRMRGTEDEVTFDEFQAEEAAQSNPSNALELNLPGVKAKCDIFLENNGSNLTAFKAEVVKKLEL